MTHLQKVCLKAQSRSCLHLVCGRGAAALATAQQGAVQSEMSGLGHLRLENMSDFQNTLNWKICTDQIVHQQLIKEIQRHTCPHKS